MRDRGTPDLERALAVVRSGYEHQTRARIHEIAEAHDLSPADLYNALALSVARRFLEADMPFDEADEIANTIYAIMVEDALASGDGFEFPEPAFGIYGAFDQGEWDRRDGFDPVERYTRPALREILSHHAGTP